MMMPDDVVIARALHVLSVAHWIGGVAFVTLIVLPLARAQGAPELFEAVERRFARQVRLSVPLAGAIELSPFYFTRMFKAATGKTPLDYVMETRVEEAERLLQGTILPLAEIGRRVGFRTQAHFSTVFRKRRGVAPRTVRIRPATA